MKTILVFSGGLDSTTLLHHLLDDGNQVKCLSFDYGQTHSIELDYAQRATAELNIQHDIISLHGVFSGSSLTGDKEMPTSEYSVETMKKTVVPNRNMVMLSIAVSKAIAEGYDAVAYGCHAGDKDVYPDCRPEFVQAMRSAIWKCDWSTIDLITPFIGMTKKEIVQRAIELGVDISKTWSCYSGGTVPCGVCGSCVARIEAMY